VKVQAQGRKPKLNGFLKNERGEWLLVNPSYPGLTESPMKNLPPIFGNIMKPQVSGTWERPICD
jgi:hypothetical protein